MNGDTKFTFHSAPTHIRFVHQATIGQCRTIDLHGMAKVESTTRTTEGFHGSSYVRASHEITYELTIEDVLSMTTALRMLGFTIQAPGWVYREVESPPRVPGDPPADARTPDAPSPATSPSASPPQVERQGDGSL